MQSQAQPMSYSQASSMRQQDPFPPNKTIAIAGRSNDIWGQSDPAAKRPRLAEPPGRLKMSGRSRMGEHADNLGGPNQAYRPSGQRQNVSAYDGNVPAGSAEPMD